MPRRMPDVQDYLTFIADRFLGVRPRSEKEMRDYFARKLVRYQLNEEEASVLIDQQIAKLIEAGLVDDSSFARWYASEKAQFKRRGAIRIRLELRQKGISVDIIDSVLSAQDEADVEIIKNLLETKYRSHNMNDFNSTQKLKNSLLRRGFSHQDIKTAIEEISSEE